MSVLTQEGKFIAVETSLGDDELILLSFSGTEYMSKPFDFQLEMLSLNHDIKAADIVGQKIDIKIVFDEDERYLNGYVLEWIAGSVQPNGYRLYHAKLIPWLQLLSFNSDCRVFQNMDVSGIIEDVFNSKGYSDFEINTNRSFRDREYTVQYRESDFQFVSRLLEEEGIYYYFKHEKGKHTMIIGDAVSVYDTCVQSDVSYIDGQITSNQLTEWVNQYKLITGKWAQTDYNFTTPKTDISTTIASVIDLPLISEFERYDYPGLYANRADGDGLTKVRIEEEETTYNIVNAAGTYRSFTVGAKFTLADHDVESEKGKEYVLTSVTHYARENNYDLGESGGHEYYNSFQCIPADVAYKPPRVTPKPFVQGLQTAVVVGPSGEEIYVDEYGRVKVQFFWDRVGANDENSSCWLRVAQQWAGNKRGAIFNPRIGDEVVVSFLEGNPDSPLVTGSVYNADNMPPYELPANKTQSGWKTRSTKDGGSANFNELRFEDLKGKEEIYIHAEKDQNNLVENNETTFVGKNRTEDVGNDETISIGNDRTENVGNNETITISNNRTESVGKNETISIGENRTEDVGKNETISIGVNQTINIGKNKTEEIGKVLKLKIGDMRTTEVAKDDELKIGKKLTVEAGDQITFKTGKASIVMKKDGTIIIKGKNIKIQGAGKIDIKASKNVTVKGSKIMQN